MYAENRVALLETVFAEVGDDALLVDPSSELLTALAQFGTQSEASVPSLRVLAPEETLKGLRSEFLTAAKAADLIEQDLLEFRITAGATGNTVVASEDALYALVEVDGEFAALAAEDDDFIAGAYSSYADRFETSEPFALRTPGLTHAFDTLEAQLSTATRDDFETLLTTVETTDTDGLDEVSLALLAAAKNTELLYEISKWGEDIGVASKATFSRSKTNLEDRGIIDTEKVPIDVGRPRLRLQLGDDELQAASAEELPGLVRSRQ